MKYKKVLNFYCLQNVMPMSNKIWKKQMLLNSRFRQKSDLAHGIVLSVRFYCMEQNPGRFRHRTINRLELFAMWTYWRILKIPWTDNITNTAVPQNLNNERQLGHMLRKNKHFPSQLVTKSKIVKKRGIGRKKF